MFLPQNNDEIVIFTDLSNRKQLKVNNDSQNLQNWRSFINDRYQPVPNNELKNQCPALCIGSFVRPSVLVG
jgi:hypothetical protein